ncbi:MAG: sulfite exporter TauE/SafE family protein [Tepidisphaerales bacterium]
MLPLIATILIASLLGSLHCVGMCGAFVAVAAGDHKSSTGRHALLQGAYHGGRLVTYTLLGLAAGAAGATVNLGAALAGIKPLAAAVAGAVMVAFGLVSLLRLNGWSPKLVGMPPMLGRVLAAAHRSAMSRPPVVRAAVIGLLTTLLPCGWLYAFTAAAAGTARPWMGALVMGVFWLGTLPALVALGVSVRTVIGLAGQRLQLLTCVALVAVGVYTITGRSLRDVASMTRNARSALQHPQATPPCCQEKP